MAYTFDTSVYLGALGEVDVTITYNYSPATPDVMYLPNGDPGYPGDPAEVEVLKLEWHDAFITATFDDLDQATQDDLIVTIMESADDAIREARYEE